MVLEEESAWANAVEIIIRLLKDSVRKGVKEEGLPKDFGIAMLKE